MDLSFLGNKDLLKLPKTAFLSSRKISPTAVLKCYDWATQERDKGTCIISGFHSPLEKDVLTFLLKGKQPIILVMGRALYKQIPDLLQNPLKENRLLLISPVSQTIKRQSQQNCFTRNNYIIEIADKVVFGSLDEKGSLYRLYLDAKANGKHVEIIS